MLFQPFAPIASDSSFGMMVSQTTLYNQEGRSGSIFDVLSRVVDCMPVGNTIYHFRSPSRATWYPRSRGEFGEVTFCPCNLAIVGRGKTFEEALTSWSEQFHTRFQTLLAKRSWEMTQQELEEWENIDQMVDIAMYRRETPQRVRRIGELTRRRPVPDRVRWEDGRQESVSVAIAPPEFAALHEGHRFEADVLLDSTTGKLLQIVFLKRLPALETEGDEELWESLKTTKDEPSIEWEELD